MFVHHPDRDHSGQERVGSRTVRFRDGVAEVTIPSVLARYRKAGYTITDRRGRPADAPAGNASTDEWRAYAYTVADPGTASSDEIDAMSRDELRARFGKPVTDPPTSEGSGAVLDE